MLMFAPITNYSPVQEHRHHYGDYKYNCVGKFHRRQNQKQRLARLEKCFGIVRQLFYNS